MGQPVPSGSLNDLKVAVAFLKFGGVDMGLVSSVKATTKEMTTPVNTDQLGKTKVNDFHVGWEIQVEFMMDEWVAKKIAKAFGHASLITSGSDARIAWGKPIGQDYRSIAQSLVIIPSGEDTGVDTKQFKYWLAAPIGDSSFEYKVDGKLQAKGVFHIYPDLTQDSVTWLGYFGNVSAGTFTHAVAAAAVAGSNTGNGTVTGEVVNDTFTKTETWTLTCIHAVTNGGLFSVVGSVTGSRGVATVGSLFSSNSITPSNSELQFTINDGTTDFIVGDTFTIATTAANYA